MCCVFGAASAVIVWCGFGVVWVGRVGVLARGGMVLALRISLI